MAGIMTAPMLIIEIFLMKSMYKDKQSLTFIMIASIIILVVFFGFIRKQALVKDKQFLKSMIPHHSSAILMCEEASITDQEIQNLCKQIIEAQKKEITIMQKKLQQLEDNQERP